MKKPDPDTLSLVDPDVAADEARALFARIRDKSPRVHCLTSSIARPFTANALLAAGAVPSMTYDPDEVADFVAGADALLVNLGIADAAMRHSVQSAIAAANDHAVPWVLDPVFVDRSPRRAAFAIECLGQSPAIVKTNAAEAAALKEAIPDPGATGIVTVITGETDLVRHGGQEQRVAGGHTFMQQVTAMGCALGAIMAAALAVEEDPLRAAITTLIGFSQAGEKAGALAAGPGSFEPAFLDAIATYSSAKIH